MAKDEETPTNKSRDLLTTYSCDKWKTLHMHSYSCNNHETWQGGDLVWREPIHQEYAPLITWSRDKLKNLYLHFHNTYGYQTWDGVYLW